ncbi:MAG TPA: contractile injection system protein, VgrG/Pvc8 family [Bryobacteraceae bacterium]|nr:contractile injection system protein, VgrG/Pvc8 family [Bryobacteraceae bacterium]
MPASSYQLLLDGQAADDDFYTQLNSLEVEENLELPGAFQLHLPVSRTDTGELTFVNDSRFRPLASFAVVASVEGLPDECIFDGVVLSHKLHLQTGTTSSTLEVWGQDASWLMNLEEKVKEWVDVTDAQVAESIFGDYGIEPAEDNDLDESPTHPESGHSLMQHGSDIQFLRTLAKRTGKVVRVVCADKPGVRTGFFAKPNLDASPATTLVLNDPESWTVDALDLEWDMTRPTSVKTRQAFLGEDQPAEGVAGDTDDSGLPLLDDRDLATFSGQPMTALLTAPVDDAGELSMRAAAVLRDSDWFVRCQGEADVARLNLVLRAGSVVELAGIGSLHSGKYLVWSVRHTITQDSHRMRFSLMRNAVGPEPLSAGGLLGGLP